MTRAALLVLAALAALLAMPATGANVNAPTQNPANSVITDSASSYFNVFSPSTHPAPVPGGWATRRNSNPAVPAATGADFTTAAHLGGWPRITGTVNQVVVFRTAAAFPPGVTSITLRGLRIADAATGAQPITAGRFSLMNGTGGGATITLGANQFARMNLDVSTVGLTNGATYVPHVRIWATFTGQSGAFYAYTIPVRVFVGNGAG